MTVDPVAYKLRILRILCIYVSTQSDTMINVMASYAGKKNRQQ